MAKVVYASNGGAIGDGVRVTRISGGGTKFEVMVDPKTERYSEVVLAADAPDPAPDTTPDPAPPPVVTPPPVTSPPVVGGNLQAWLRAAAPGDTIHLPDGTYGSEVISGCADNITLQAETKHGAHFERLTLTNVRGLTISDIAGWPLSSVPVSNNKLYCITGDATATDVMVDGALFMGHPDGQNYARWQLADWRDRAQGGVILDGSGCSVMNSTATGVRFGFALTGDVARFSNLRVMGMSGDAYRCGGSNTYAIGILAADAVYMNDGNHPDAFQAFGKRVNGANTLLSGLTIERFLFLEWLHNAPDSQLRFNANLNRFGILQGVGLHNPPYSNVTLRDGIVKVGTANGVKISGAAGATAERVATMNVDHGRPAYDARFPKIDITGSNLTLIDCQAEQFAGSVATGHNGTKPDYSAPLPAWAQALVA